MDLRQVFDIAAQPLDLALLMYSRQAGITVMSASPSLADKRAPRLHGAATPREALKALLAGSRLTFTITGPQTVAIVPRPSLFGPRADTAAAPFAPVTAAPVEVAPERVRQLTEVIVTAEKREADIQRVPVAVTAVTQAGLTRAGLQDFLNINKLAPELNVTRGNSAFNIQIRGIMSNNFGPTGDSPNAVHLDGGYIARAQGVGGMLYDLARIEILLGPQGTLYGRNSTAGAINIITNRPTPMREGHLEVEVGGYDLLRLTGVANLPVTERLSVRIAGQHYAHDGYFRDTGGDDKRDDGLRAQMLWRATPSQSLLVSADYERQGGKGASANIDQAVTANVIAPRTPRENRALYGDGDLIRQNTVTYGALGEYNADLGPVKLTMLGNARQVHVHGRSSGATRGFYQMAFAPAATQSDLVAKWNTQEIRLTSPAGRRLVYVAGLYRYGERTGGQALSYISPTSTTILSNIANPYMLARAYAVFGQATYTPESAPRLHLTLGLRYSYDRKTANGYTYRLGSPTVSFDGSEHWDAITYRTNLAFDLNPRTLLYATVANGYKSGGFAYGTQPLYQPEFVTDYEAGFKTRLWNDRLQFDSNVFVYNYRDFESSFALQTVINGQNVLIRTETNVGSAKVYGASFDIQAAPTRWDTVRAQVSLLHAVYGSFDLSGLGPNLFDYSGTRIGLTTPVAATVTYNHQWPTAAGAFDAQMALQIAGRRVLAQQARPGTPDYIVQAASARADISLRYRPARGHWTATAYVNNVTNALVRNTGAYSAGVFNGAPFAYSTASYQPPRTIGAVLATEF